MALGLLSGCAVFQDYSGDTCDGKKPVATMEQAGKDRGITVAIEGQGSGKIDALDPDGKSQQIAWHDAIRPFDGSAMLGTDSGPSWRKSEHRGN